MRRRLFGLVYQHRALFSFGLLCAFVGAALQAATLGLLPPLLQHLFPDEVKRTVAETARESSWLRSKGEAFLAWVTGPGPNEAQVNRLLLVFMMIIVVRVVANYSAAYLSVLVQERVVRDLRARVYAHLLRLDLGIFQRTRGGQLIAGLVNEADQVKMVVVATFAAFFQNAVLITGYIAAMWFISLRLTLFVLGVAPFLVLAISLLRRRLRRHTRSFVHERGVLMARVSERVAAIKLIRASGTEQAELEDFNRQAQRYQKGIVRTQRFALMTSPVGEIFGGALIVGVLLMASGFGLDSEKTIGFVMAAVSLLGPVKAISQAPVQLQIAEASAERIFEVMDTPASEVDLPNAREARFERDLTFEDVTFGYDPATPVLRNVSLTVKKGEMIALVGPSGAGKTTLLDLVPRFFDPQQGVIRLDGAPLTELTRHSLRALLAIVGQETVLLHDTVRANIAYGRPGASDADIETAARAANALEFISALPEGYQTILGERGTRLSGGQRQRIAIARALLRDAPILILDEATSALDTESERLVQEAIDRLVQHRTVLVIAHRLATVRHADRIVVLDQGRVVESGSHDTLLTSSGLYRRLHDLQFATEEGPS